MKQFREDAKLTAFELAVESGVSIRTIARIENDPEYRPMRLTMVKLLDVIGKRLGKAVTPEDVGITLAPPRPGRPRKEGKQECKTQDTTA